jgi:hypothetical protein
MCIYVYVFNTTTLKLSVVGYSNHSISDSHGNRIHCISNICYFMEAYEPSHSYIQSIDLNNNYTVNNTFIKTPLNLRRFSIASDGIDNLYSNILEHETSQRVAAWEKNCDVLICAFIVFF